MKVTKTMAMILASGTIAISAAAITMPKVAKGEIDLPGVEATLANHSARISNNEKDIKALQDNTNTPAAPDHVDVPTATSQPLAGPPSVNTEVAVNAPTPAETKTVLSANVDSVVPANQVAMTEDNYTPYWCHYTFDDGSTKVVYRGQFPTGGPQPTCPLKVGDVVSLNWPN